MNRRLLPLVLVTLAMTFAGCATYDRSQGVANTWRDPAIPTPVKGQTTQSDIIEALGPPSQVIGLRDQTVFYYLRERRKGNGAVLLVYNWVKENVTYDRAIYFFDQNGVLLDYGYSNETIAR
jgi:outer membrane protein assembly factor BamE (lipoprotein component of BamABCDE complex)